MTIQSVLLPVFVLVFMIFFVLFWMIKERMSGVRSGEVASANTSANKDAFQPKAKQLSSCLQNQFEMPPLFFILVILAIITRKADLTFVVMEWLYVLLRLGHAFIFTTSNDHRYRGPLFMGSALILLIMWVIFAVRILLAPTFGAV